MPVVHVDTEQAALLAAALQMFEAALLARVERADPEQIISNSLALQARKLATVRTLLALPDPPTWSALSERDRKRALLAVEVLISAGPSAHTDEAWSKLRDLANAPGLPG